MSNYKFSIKTEQKIIKAYKIGHSTLDLGKQFNCSGSTICFILKRNKVKRRTYSEAGNKGARYIDPNGYVSITPKDCDKWLNNNSKHTMLEHRFVMARYLNRPLTRYETVHHKNGNRQDNRIQNLELWTKSQPSGQRVKDKIKWAKSFLKQYGYSVK